MFRRFVPAALTILAAVTASAFAQDPPAPLMAATDDWSFVMREVPALEESSDTWTIRFTEAQDPAVQSGSSSSPQQNSASNSADADEEGGFLYGLRGGFESKPRPIDSPLYFEDPYISTEIRPLYLWHTFPKSSPLGNGDLQVAAVQARLAITERIAFIATEDGYSWMDTDAFGTEKGWMDLAIGLKAALWVDQERDFILTVGGRYTVPAGDRDVLKSFAREWSVFVTAAQGFNNGRTNLIGNVNLRVPFSSSDGNSILNWDAHLNTELCEDFAQVIEVHGLHYLSNGERFAVDVGGLDYANIGSQRAAGNMALWGTVGFRWRIVEHVSFGAGYGFSLKGEGNNDIFESRVVASLNFRL